MRVAEVWICLHQKAASGQEEDRIRELPGSGPRQVVWIKIRGVSFGP